MALPVSQSEATVGGPAPLGGEARHSPCSSCPPAATLKLARGGLSKAAEQAQLSADTEVLIWAGKEGLRSNPHSPV